MTFELVHTFESAAFAGTTIEVDTLQIREALNEPYLATAVLLHPDRDADMTQLLGKDGTFTVGRAGLLRTFHGIVTKVTEGEPVMPDGTIWARIELSPALHLLKLRRNTRMFQNETVPDILQTVLEEALGPYSREITLSLDESYDPREYCLQYQETDFEFVSRLMEEEGISYHFDQSGEKEVLVLGDGNGVFERAETLEDAILYQPNELAAPEHENFYSFRVGMVHTTTATSVGDWDWTQGNMIVREEGEDADARGRVRESYEHGWGHSVRIHSYDEGARRYQAHDAVRQKGIRLEAKVRDLKTARGISRAIGLGAAKVFTISGHHEPGVDGDWLITEVVHRALAENTEMGTAGAYENTVVCIPADTPYRPVRRTPKPSIGGVQTAVVTGPSGEEIHVDEHGRIKVLFHWDRENAADENSSCWIRVKQEWAGAGWGWWWVPRIGMEVLVHFIDGDPDRPLVTGVFYDADRPTPYALPDEKTKSTIKSESSLGGGGFNEFRFEDKAGSEQIFTHAQKDYNEVVENDHNTLVHHDQSNEVDVDQTQTIHNNQTERVDVDQTMTIGGNRTVHVEGNYDETVDGTETRHTVGDVTETFESTETRTIGASVTETIGADETRTIATNQTESITGDHTLTVGAAQDITVTGAFSESIDGGITTTTPGAVTATAVGGWNLTADGGITFIAAAGAKIIAPGGMQRIDYEWDTKAACAETVFAAVNFETYVGKLGICTGADVSFAAYRVNDKANLKIARGAATAAKALRTAAVGFANRVGAAAVSARQILRL